MDANSELFTLGKQSKNKVEGQVKKTGLFQQYCSAEALPLRQGADGAEVDEIKFHYSDAHELRKLVAHDHNEDSVTRQCELLGLPRSMLNYRPVPVRQSTLRIMDMIETQYREEPCSANRWMADYMAREEIPISRERVRNLMRRMGLQAIYQRPHTTV